MRTCFPVVLALCLTAATTASAAEGELRGAARTAGRTEPNVVVWLDVPSGPSGATAPEPVLDQRNLQFFPQVLVVRVGTTVKFPNTDRVFHNVFSFKDGKQFDLGVYPVGAVKHVRFDRPGISRLFCNIHPKMAAYVVAVDSPYFAMSDERGAFAIQAPAGTYTYHAWRAGGPVLNGSVTVGSATTLDIQWP